MENTPGSARHRGTSTTSLSDDEGGETENEPGGLSSTNTGSTTNLGAMEDHNRPKHTNDEAEILSKDVGYGCKASRKHMSSGRVPALQQPKLNTISTAELGKGMPAEESKRPSPEPPVTKTTLSELDIPRIVYNPKLRHDVNFDPDLHFRPNLDGECGRRKTQKAEDFWSGLRAQIGEFMADPAAFESKPAGKEWSLPSTLQAIGEILATLVPPEDRSAVEEILSVELLMQQFRKGQADLEKLGLWLARTLKSHCAPMRDEWVDEIVLQLSVGDRDRNITSVVDGLQSLLGVLEAMKLDVANHQIRCLRPLLIQDTVEFEQTFFMKKIALRKIDIAGAHAWFQAAKSLPNNDQLQTALSHGDMWVFFRGFADFLLPSKMGASIPDSFMFDEERIDKLRAEISDAINLDVCVRLLENIHSKDHSLGTQTTTITSVPPRPQLRSLSPMRLSGTHNSIMKTTDVHTVPKFPRETKVTPFSKTTRRFNKERNLDESFGSFEIQSEDDESDTESAPSTRRTSFSSMTSISIMSPLSRSVELPAAPIDPKISRAISAIVNDTQGNNRWQQSCSDIALELLRSAPDHEDLFRLESQLGLHLCNPTSSVFQESECRILAELYPLLSDLAARYSHLTATQLFEVATSPRPLPYQANVPPHALSDVVKQMAHIGVLHWRVWAPLAYLVNPDDTGHVTEATDPESRAADKAWGQVAENKRRPISKRQNSMSESIPMGS